jgi:hypothetical protein
MVPDRGAPAQPRPRAREWHERSKEPGFAAAMRAEKDGAMDSGAAKAVAPHAVQIARAPRSLSK